MNAFPELEQALDPAESIFTVERSEYETLIHVGKLMSILRLKAGVLLQNFKAA